jgi:thiol-disulfide isomerase/thioredoxin
MKYRIVFIGLFSMFLLWQACDKIEAPYFRITDTVPVDSTVEVMKMLLIEEFTGHHCPNCPEGAVAIENIVNQYGDQVVIVGIHTSYFGRPTVSMPADYRIAAGDELDKFFGMEAGLPAGMVNRTGFSSGTHRLGPEELQGRVIELLESDPVMDVEVEVNYETMSRNAGIEVNVTLLEEMQRKMYLSVFITEDSLISKQKNNNELIGPTPEIEDYVHRHVLRAAVNDTWGDILCDGNLLLPSGTGYTKVYNFVLPHNWNHQQCAIVAFVHDGETYEVLQATEQKIR